MLTVTAITMPVLGMHPNSKKPLKKNLVARYFIIEMAPRFLLIFSLPLLFFCELNRHQETQYQQKRKTDQIFSDTGTLFSAFEKFIATTPVNG